MSDEQSTGATSATFRAAAERSAAVEARLATHPEEFRMLTGDRPTGALHVGHLAEPSGDAVPDSDAGASVSPSTGSPSVVGGWSVGSGATGDAGRRRIVPEFTKSPARGVAFFPGGPGCGDYSRRDP